MLKLRFEKLNAQFGVGVSPSQGAKETLQWLMFARLVGAYSVLGVLVLQQVFQKTFNTNWIWAYGLLSIAFGFNFISSLLIERIPAFSIVPFFHVLFDSVLIAAWIYRGGNLLVLLFLVQILVVALTLYKRGAIFSAALATILLGFTSLTLSEWAVYSLLFIALGVVGGFLSEELLRTTETLKERNRAIEKLTQLHERIIANMPTGLLTVDRNMQINFINPAAEHILNVNSREAVGRKLVEVEPGLLPFFSQIEAQPIEDGNVEEATLSATGTDHHRTVFLEPRAQKGHARLQQTVEVGRGKALKTIRGDVAELDPEAGLGRLLDKEAAGGRVLLFQDVTRIVGLEEKLRQNEKLAAVGQLAAGIAHEIRNPLASMSASIEMLKSSGELKDSENQKLMDIAIREIDRLNGLISEFLDFVKPEKMKLIPVSLTEMVIEVISQIKNEKGRAIDIQFEEQCDGDIQVMGSGEKLKQVLLNLVINAVQATKKASTISIGCKNLNQQRVVLWVQDQGEGMTDEVLSHLYEPFFTTKAKGTGLGLATAYKIIEAHHGEIHVSSKPGHGTRFEIQLMRA